MALGKAEFEQAKLQVENLWLKIRVVGTTAGDTGIKGYCTNVGLVGVYTDEDAQTIAAALGFTTTELDDDAAAAIIGVHVPVGDAAEIVDVRLGLDSAAQSAVLASGSSLGTLSAVTTTLYGASNTGVTTAGDLAFTLTLTSLDIDSAIGEMTFWIAVAYRKTAVS